MSGNINELVIFVEEQSAKVMLEQGLLPKIVPKHIEIRCIPFEGKQDLDKRVGLKLRAWQNPQAAFVIMRDKDSGDCLQIKQNLQKICIAAGKPNTLIRIVCHELESWYLGDLSAVEKGFGINGIAKHQQNKKYKAPDNLANAKQELKRLTKNQYQQIGGSRSIGPHLTPEKNNSHSFRIFVEGIIRILENGQ